VSNKNAMTMMSWRTVVDDFTCAYTDNSVEVHKKIQIMSDHDNLLLKLGENFPNVETIAQVEERSGLIGNNGRGIKN